MVISVAAACLSLEGCGHYLERQAGVAPAVPKPVYVEFQETPLPGSFRVGDTISLGLSINGIPQGPYAHLVGKADKVRIYLWVPEELELIAEGGAGWRQVTPEALARFPSDSFEFVSRQRKSWDADQWRLPRDRGVRIVFSFEKQHPQKGYALFALEKPFLADLESYQMESSSSLRALLPKKIFLKVSLKVIKPAVPATEISAEAVLLRGGKVIWKHKSTNETDGSIYFPSKATLAMPLPLKMTLDPRRLEIGAEGKRPSLTVTLVRENAEWPYPRTENFNLEIAVFHSSQDFRITEGGWEQEWHRYKQRRSIRISPDDEPGVISRITIPFQGEVADKDISICLVLSDGKGKFLWQSGYVDVKFHANTVPAMENAQTS